MSGDLTDQSLAYIAENYNWNANNGYEDEDENTYGHGFKPKRDENGNLTDGKFILNDLSPKPCAFCEIKTDGGKFCSGGCADAFLKNNGMTRAQVENKKKQDKMLVQWRYQLNGTFVDDEAVEPILREKLHSPSLNIDDVFTHKACVYKCVNIVSDVIQARQPKAKPIQLKTVHLLIDHRLTEQYRAELSNCPHGYSSKLWCEECSA